ncbi:Thiamine biosynthesis protein ThiS [Candidatus Hydrogenisulfobacillus filiaventi]|uniref:Thiamine biosynthesis protein ThiS n=1 Tax=Candidatus Hydrogenisulfobacillus filiaventi TaxID=2707344 RepID=A0A6F8ZGX3_9FIRM|nr:sulfur carrier protein ThiS [Bacillota bacterium]CAB1128842.1 Thiamine biosynthesis protein ThiS [Candidatus Hydrogenisulfobacillus filiaventi]
MRLRINGEWQDIPEPAPGPLTVAALLEALGVSGRAVAVLHNGTPLGRDQFDARPLAADDELEIVRFVGGG